MQYPSSWKTGAIGSFFETATGTTPPKSQKDNYGSFLPFVKPPELLDSEILDTSDNLSEKGALLSRNLPSNSILISCIGNLGKVGINFKPVAFNQQINAIKPNESLISKFMFYQALSSKFKLQLEELASGTTVPIVNKSKFNSIKIVVPPLETQKQIVAKLDQAFADIEKAKVNAEQNLKNAHELLLSQRHEMFHAMSLESDLVPLTSVCNEIFAGGDAPKGNFSKDLSEKYKIPIYANAVKNNGLYGFTDIARALKPAITVAARGSGTGHVEMRMKPFFPIVRLIVLIPDSAVIILEYLKYAILGLDILSSGSAIPQLTVPMIKGYSVPLPSLKVQRLMIEKFNKLSEQIACLESIYKEKINCLDELKQSILQKAFNGEIT
jgi:type I restriction enzyme S subunit